MTIYSMLAVFRRCLFIFTITFGRIHYYYIYHIILYISTYILKLHSNSLICSVYLYCFSYDRSVLVVIYIYTHMYLSVTIYIS